MNILKTHIGTFKFIQQGRWKRKLRLLDAMRPRLIRSEYLKQVEERGFKMKNVKVVYNVLDEYITLMLRWKIIADFPKLIIHKTVVFHYNTVIYFIVMAIVFFKRKVLS